MYICIGLRKYKLWQDDRTPVREPSSISRILFGRSQSVSSAPRIYRIRGVHERPAAGFRTFYACSSGSTGNLVELNNSARPINVTTRPTMSRRIRERGPGGGWRHARYAHVLFHRNVPEGLHIPSHLRSRDPPRGYNSLVLCGLSRFPKLLPTISCWDSFVNLQICQESPRCADAHIRIILSAA